MINQTRLKNILTNDWVLSAILLGLFLITNRYILGWDDQHLEIPLLKHLIDPTLFQGDYYVESLKKNFTTYLYPILARLISTEQIPAVYLTLYIISRYFFFFWLFKIWEHVSKEKWIAFTCVLMSFLIGRTEEMLYRTFSHQEFAFAIIFAGIYMFYKERYIVSAIILGIAANFHFLYAVFPMFYISIYFLFFAPKKRLKSFFQTGISFVITALPFLLWAIPEAIEKRVNVDPALFENWIDVFVVACPYNFLFLDYPLAKVLPNLKEAVFTLGPWIFIGVTYVFLFVFDKAFRSDRKIQAFSLGPLLLLVASFYVSYIHPSRFGLDLNLSRNNQYWQLFLMGYLTIFFCQLVKDKQIFKSLLMSVLFSFLVYRDILSALVIALIGVVWFCYESFQSRKLSLVATGGVVLFIALASIVLSQIPNIFVLQNPTRANRIYVSIGLGIIIFLAVTFVKNWKNILWLRKLFVMIPLAIMFVHFCNLHYFYVHMRAKAGGFWQLQRNWEDMQHYVRRNTPKDAKFLIPYDMEMGGFRIFSEREIVVSYRDVGIVGFDYPAVLEWQRRIDDIKPFKVISREPIQSAIINGVQKYDIDYIVFMGYYAPRESNPYIQEIYANETYKLFKVNK